MSDAREVDHWARKGREFISFARAEWEYKVYISYRLPDYETGTHDELSPQKP